MSLLKMFEKPLFALLVLGGLNYIVLGITGTNLLTGVVSGTGLAVVEILIGLGALMHVDKLLAMVDDVVGAVKG